MQTRAISLPFQSTTFLEDEPINEIFPVLLLLRPSFLQCPVFMVTWIKNAITKAVLVRQAQNISFQFRFFFFFLFFFPFFSFLLPFSSFFPSFLPFFFLLGEGGVVCLFVSVFLQFSFLIFCSFQDHIFRAPFPGNFPKNSMFLPQKQ
jgi:hypothetical protein